MFSIRELTQAYELIRVQADTDSLTSLPNRRCFINTLSREMDRCTRYGGVVTLAMIDIDHFKQVNDKYGHAAGDKVLQTLATIFVDQFRNVDWIGRLGGEEFAVVFPETDLKGATVACERLLGKLRAMEMRVGANHIGVTVSVGLTELSTPYRTAADFLEKADQLLYRAKAGGRNQIQADYFRPKNTSSSIEAAINS